MKQPLQGEVLTKGRERYELQPVWWGRQGQRDPVSRTKATGNKLFQRSSEWLSDEPEKGGGEPEAVLGNLCVPKSSDGF